MIRLGRELRADLTLEADLCVVGTGAGGAMVARQAARAGLRVVALSRRGCVGSGFCELGCAFDAKENALKVLVPEAVAAGAQVVADCRAEQILVERGRAVGVLARALGADGRPGPTVTVRGAVCL